MDGEKPRAPVHEGALRDSIAKALAASVGIRREDAQSMVDESLQAARIQPRTCARALDPASDPIESEWSQPVPLRTLTEPPPFPVRCLSRWQREWVEGEAYATQTPVDLAAMLSLAVTSACCAPRFRVQARAGWIEPTNVFVCVALPPGSRKTAVFRDAIAPILDFERAAGEAMMPAIANASAMLRIAQQRQAAAEEAAARRACGDRVDIEAELQAATLDLVSAKAAVQTVPQLICNDTTQERLVSLLAANGGCMALMDGEGCGPVATMLGRYSPSQSPQVDVFLRAHAGDPVRVDRVSRESVVVNDPRLTMGITVQPMVVERLRREPELRGLGLLARILWCVPKSNIGSRLSRTAAVSETVRRDYARSIGDLLSLENGPNGPPRLVALSRAADDMLDAFQTGLEPRLGLGGDLEHLAGWASKLAGAVVRLAGLLHAADMPRAAYSTEISDSTLRRAIEIGEYLLAHAQLALAQVSVDPVISDAEHILAWLRMNGIREISKRNLFTALRGRFPTVERLNPVLTVLKAHHWIAEFDQPAEGRRGRRPSPMYRVHPSAHNAQNAQNRNEPVGAVHSAHCAHSAGETGKSLPPKRS